MLLASITVVLMIAGIISSPSLDPVDAVFGCFMVGQLLFNAYILARFDELLASASKSRRKK
jgi:hypothetical protein